MQKILYFTRDFSAENQALAAQHHFVMRNANAYHDGDFIEQCDAVYGDVPQAYLDRFPLFELPQAPQEPKKSKSAKGAKNEPANTE